MSAAARILRHRRRAARRGRASAGMTLIEIMVALGVAAVIFTAGAMSLASAMGGVGFARQNQQAAELLAETIERARANDFAAVAVKQDAGALAADARLTGSSSAGYKLDPDGAGPLPSESLVTSPYGTVTLSQVITRNGVRYTVSAYVTTPSGANAAYRRVSTFVSWSRGQDSHERSASTFITSTRRGLPLPEFDIGTASVRTVNRGATLVLPVTLTNRGARDRWNLTVSNPADGWGVSWYVDDNGDGAKGVAETTPLPDSDADGTPDTGLLETDQVRKMVGVASVPAGASTGTFPIVVTATSASDPSVAKSVTHEVTVVDQSCPGCTFRTLYMGNNDHPPINSVLQPLMDLDAVPGPSVSLPNFDVDQNADPGRTLTPGGSGAGETDARKIAIWETEAAAETRLNGDVVVTLIAAMRAPDNLKKGALRFLVTTTPSTGGVPTVHGSATTLPLQFGTGFSTVKVTVPVTNLVIPQKARLQVRVLAPSSDDALWLAYGTAAYASSVSLPLAP